MQQRQFKTLLVTGGCGFIGANFIRFVLMGSGFQGQIINVDKLTYAGNPENLSDIVNQYNNRYHFVHADICESSTLENLFQSFHIDAICHFAAESHVDRSIDRPDDFIRTNINGTFTLLELARKFQDQIVLFHHVSTDEVYGSLTTNGFFTEKTPYHPNSPYSASKAASDHLVNAYAHTYNLPITLSNCSNNYGPYQFPEKLIPLIILNALSDKPLPIYGNGKNVRDWLYVLDHCKAIWTIMNHGSCGETYLIGGHNELQNIHVVEKICDVLDDILPKQNNPRRSLIQFVKDRPGHDFRYAIDCSKLNNELNWYPSEDFETGIRKTIQWYMDHPQWVHHVQTGEYKRWIETHYQL